MSDIPTAARTVIVPSHLTLDEVLKAIAICRDVHLLFPPEQGYILVPRDAHFPASRSDIDTLIKHLRRGTADAVPHSEVQHATREGPPEVPGDQVSPSPQRGDEQTVEPGPTGPGEDQREVRNGEDHRKER